MSNGPGRIGRLAGKRVALTSTAGTRAANLANRGAERHRHDEEDEEQTHDKDECCYVSRLCRLHDGQPPSSAMETGPNRSSFSIARSCARCVARPHHELQFFDEECQVAGQPAPYRTDTVVSPPNGPTATSMRHPPSPRSSRM